MAAPPARTAARGPVQQNSTDGTAMLGRASRRRAPDSVPLEAPIRSHDVHEELLSLRLRPEFVKSFQMAFDYGATRQMISFAKYRIILREKSLVDNHDLNIDTQSELDLLHPEQRSSAFYKQCCDVRATLQFCQPFADAPLQLPTGQDIGMCITFAPTSPRYHKDFVFEVFRASPNAYRITKPGTPSFGTKEGVIVVGDELSSEFLPNFVCDPSRATIVIDPSDAVSWIATEIAFEIPYARFLRLLDLQLSDPPLNAPVVRQATRPKRATAQVAPPSLPYHQVSVSSPTRIAAKPSVRHRTGMRET